MQNDSFYQYLLHQCQSTDLQRRLEALEDLRRHHYLDLVEPPFLLDRLHSTSSTQEQSAILRLMCEINKPLPIDALMAILEETSSVYLSMEIAHTLAVTRAEEVKQLFIRLALDREEHPWLREMVTGNLSRWKEQISDELLLTLLADPAPGVCTAALEVFRSRPEEAIPLEAILPYATHERKYIREEAIKTLMAVGQQRVPVATILSALHDPETEVRAAASHACIRLLEWFGDQLPLEPLLEALNDEYAAVREDLLDALGKAPARAPVEPVIAALADPVYFVRCAAVETLSLMVGRVPPSISPTLREMAESDPSDHVRERAARTFLLLHGLNPPPLSMPIVDITG